MRGNLTSFLFCSSVCMCFHAHTCTHTHEDTQRTEEDTRCPAPSLIFRREAVIKSGAHHLCWEPVIPSDPLVSSFLPSSVVQACIAASSFLFGCWGSQLGASCLHRKCFHPLSHLCISGRKKRLNFPAPHPVFFFTQPEPIVPQGFLISLENECKPTLRRKFS